MTYGVLRRLAWIAIVASFVAYSTYFVLGGAIEADASSALKPVVARDLIQNGAHHLSGMVFVPSGCHELSTSVQALDSVTNVITFETWEAPYVECVREPVPRAFRVIAFAPSPDTRFFATLDEEAIPFVVIVVDTP